MIATIQNETFQNLLGELQLGSYEPSANVLALAGAESRFIKNLKINVGNVLNNSQYLSREEALLLALAVAVNEKFVLLQGSFGALAREAGAIDAEIAEIVACTNGPFCSTAVRNPGYWRVSSWARLSRG